MKKYNFLLCCLFFTQVNFGGTVDNKELVSSENVIKYWLGKQLFQHGRCEGIGMNIGTMFMGLQQREERVLRFMVHELVMNSGYVSNVRSSSTKVRRARSSGVLCRS